MITDCYDDKTRPIISLADFYGERRCILDVCLIIFSREIHDHLLANHECAQIGELTSCNGNTPIYKLTHGGRDIAFYMSGIGSAVASSECYEVHWQTGATKFVMFGSAGSLDRAATDGRFIIPSASYRGEGSSYYFAPPSDYITVKNAPCLAAIFDEMGVPYVTGRVWTTDSMIRETVGLVEARRAEGCIAVEMELAGVQAVCDFYDMELYDFLEAGDVLDASGYEVEGLNAANHNLGKLYIALNIATRI